MIDILDKPGTGRLPQLQLAAVELQPVEGIQWPLVARDGIAVGSGDVRLGDDVLYFIYFEHIIKYINCCN